MLGSAGVPLFTLMAHFMIRGKVVDDLFGAAHTLLRHLPGGMGIATVAACTVFAAISGSSVATALTIGSAAIPLMIRYGYSPRTAYGVVGGGGTLGILIPPSGPMVLFGVVSDTSIGALFMAGIVPGLMLALIFAVYCATEAKLATKPVATEPRATWAEVVAALQEIVLVAHAAGARAGRHVFRRVHRDGSRRRGRAGRPRHRRVRLPQLRPPRPLGLGASTRRATRRCCS